MIFVMGHLVNEAASTSGFCQWKHDVEKAPPITGITKHDRRHCQMTPPLIYTNIKMSLTLQLCTHQLGGKKSRLKKYKRLAQDKETVWQIINKSFMGIKRRPWSILLEPVGRQ